MKKLSYILLTILLILVSDLNAKNKNDDLTKAYEVEINVLDYQFMRDIANFVKQTNHDSIFPQYNKVQFLKEYCFDIKDDGPIRQRVKSLERAGSYSITVSLSTGVDPFYFEVDSVRFHTFNAFVPYFNSFNHNMVTINTDINNRAFWHYFWHFEVKDGKVIDAVYYYEPTDDGYDKYDVYDLIHKEYIPYKVWKSRIHPNN